MPEASVAVPVVDCEAELWSEMDPLCAAGACWSEVLPCLPAIESWLETLPLGALAAGCWFWAAEFDCCPEASVEGACWSETEGGELCASAGNAINPHESARVKRDFLSIVVLLFSKIGVQRQWRTPQTMAQLAGSMCGLRGALSAGVNRSFV
jgi:hypothetical protein